MKRFLVIFASFLIGLVPMSAQQPWVGGLNACQFGRMDLNKDDKSDLLVFDRHGDRLSCFLNFGGEGVIDYRYTNSYDHCFPKLYGWAEFIDYDGDGKEDIFTYSKGWAGIRVYKNVSTANEIAFQLVVSPYLSSWQGGGEVNILATEADYPAIVDVDGDGDLDLLTFGVMGTFIEKQLNRSVERYGCLDSLVFERAELCWGWVGESEEDNIMYLDTCLFGKGIVVSDGLRHRGATVTVRDVTGDGLLDLLLADVDYPGLTLLVNGGTPDSAVMVSQATDFPPQEPVRLFSMPVPFFTDVDNDGVDDLLVSPFDPDPMASEGLNSIWLYLNRGSNQHPDFQLYSKSFLQNDMIDLGSGAYPVVVDLDDDGRLDLVVGTIGNIDSTWYHYGSLETRRQADLTWFRNVGTMDAPSFSQESFPYALSGIEEHIGLVPAFADLDGDHEMELLIGSSAGRLVLYDDDGTLLDEDYLHYDKSWSAPCFYDVDQDGLMDLVVGNVTGRLSFYHGTEASSSSCWQSFEKVSDFWGEVDVRDYSVSYTGYSVPSIFVSGTHPYLCVGSESGRLFLYDGLVADGQVPFQELSSAWSAFCETMPESFGMRSAAALADFDADGRMEVVVGNFSGGLQLYNAFIPVNIGVVEQEDELEVVIYPNPVQSQLHIITKRDGMHSLTIMDLYGRRWVERRLDGREFVLELSVLPSGVYLLVMDSDRGGVNRIFLKW